jgi:hypothetical protein
MVFGWGKLAWLAWEETCISDSVFFWVEIVLFACILLGFIKKKKKKKKYIYIHVGGGSGY